MKSLLLFVFLFFLWLPAAGQTKSAELDLRVNGIGIGTSYDTVLRKFGKPARNKKNKFAASQACSGKAETHLTLYYAGLEISLIGDGQGNDLSAYSIEITSAKWEIAQGIRIGADIKDVRAAFGNPLEGADNMTLAYTTSDNSGTVNFYFRNNKLVKVSVTETLC